MSFFHNIKKSFQNLIGKSYYALYYDKPSSNVHWNAKDYLDSYSLSLYVNRAIEKRAEKVGQIEFVLKNAKGDVIEEHELLKLLQKPNEYQTGRQFWSLYQKYKDLTGCAYIYMERDAKGEIFSKKVKALRLLRPDLVEKVISDGKITMFRYKGDGKVIEYSPEQIIYSYNPDPINPLDGISLLRAGIMTIDTEIQIEKYQSNIIRNGGKVEGIFKFKTPILSKESLDDMKILYAQEIAEAKNAGRPVFMGGDTDYERLGLNPEELSYIATKGLILDDICILTGVPRAVLSNVTDVKFDNADASIAIFLRETIKPLLESLTEILDWRMIPMELELSFVDPTPEDIEQELKIVESGIKNYYMTPNEAREKMGMDPIENGDGLLIPFNLTSSSESLREKKEETKTKSAEFVHPLRDPIKRKFYEWFMVKKLEREETIFTREIRKYFKEQMERALGNIKTYRKKDIYDGLSLEIELEEAKKRFKPLFRDIVLRAGRETADWTGGTFVLTEAMETWADQRTRIFAEEINKTTFKKLNEVISENISGGATREETIKDIKEMFTEYYKGRAKTIARTEVHTSVNYGNLEAYKQAGFKTKKWICTFQNSRDDHIHANGQEVAIDMPFDIGGEKLDYPGDMSGSAGNVINCQCVC